MPERLLQPDIISCNTALRAASSTQHWQLGLAYLHGAEVDGISYTSCMNSCQGGLWRLAVEFWDLLRAISEPNPTAFNSAIAASRAEWKVAHQLFAEMLDTGTSVDSYTLSSLVTSKWEAALASFHMRRREAPLIRGMEATGNALLDGCPWAVGVGILHQMRVGRIHVGCVGYTALARAFGADRWRQGAATLEQMHRREALVSFRSSLSFSRALISEVCA